MSDAQDVYDFYKGSVPLYFSVAIFTLAPLWQGWSMRLIWGGLGLATIIICWMYQARKKIYFDNDYNRRQTITAQFKLPEKHRKRLLGIILVIACGVSTIGMFKFGFGEYQFIGLAVSIFMFAMGISNLVYLRFMRRKYNLK